jgi:GNAT superfamily N-acetyltransferase
VTIEVASLTGKALAAVVPALAQLRIAVFRHWPYLYDGTMDYEARYLSKFSEMEGAVIVVARDGDAIVGCATAAPLAGVEAEFSAPFRARSCDISRIFYCGESVLLPACRGRGLGHLFFDHREAQARSLGGFAHSAFCAVVRPQDHPLRPKDYVPLDAFWGRRGYDRMEGMMAHFAWKDIDQPLETAKPMQFWIKDL